MKITIMLLFLIPVLCSGQYEDSIVNYWMDTTDAYLVSDRADSKFVVRPIIIVEYKMSVDKKIDCKELGDSRYSFAATGCRSYSQRTIKSEYYLPPEEDSKEKLGEPYTFRQGDYFGYKGDWKPFIITN